MVAFRASASVTCNSLATSSIMTAAGAAGPDIGTLAFNGTFMGLRLSAYHFGGDRAV